MGRFVYRLQSILNLKGKEESLAKMEFASCQQVLQRELSLLHGMEEQKTGYLEDGKRMRNTNGSVMEIMHNDADISCMKERIEEQTLVVDRAEEAVEEARKKLTIKMQERKMQEKLRERAFEAFLIEEKHREAIESDERSSFIYGRRIVSGKN